MIARTLAGLTAATLTVPVVAGLGWTIAVSLGHLPAIGRHGPTLEVWSQLAADPGLAAAVRLSLLPGILATALSLLLAISLVYLLHGRRQSWLAGLAAPLVAAPHAAVAVALAFLIAPSGWIARLISPWLTGWERPPDLMTVGDEWGLVLTLALVLKETPFLVMMGIAALGQIRAEDRLNVARGLGYDGPTAWFKTIPPALYPRLRLPVLAVLAYGMSVVDMAIVLAPSRAPSLSVLVVRWAGDADLSDWPLAAAGGLLQLLLVLLAMVGWWLMERIMSRLYRAWSVGGTRRLIFKPARWIAISASMFALLWAMATAALLLWSLARGWRYPEAWPGALEMAGWHRHGTQLLEPAVTTVLLAGAVALLAGGLAIGWLWHERRMGPAWRRMIEVLAYVPLIVPQISFLFGVQLLLIPAGLDGGWTAVIWVHLVFALPYALFVLAGPFRHLDTRLEATARGLGAGSTRVLWRVVLPHLSRPIALALAVAVAVSVAQYLPTLFAGAGRFATLLTETVALAGGGGRQAIAVTALLLTLPAALALSAAHLVPSRPRPGPWWPWRWLPGRMR